jgi:hypothetical protein
MCSVNEPQCHTALAQRLGHLEQIPQAASEPIELPDNERIAGEQIDNRASEGRPRSRCPRAVRRAEFRI